MARVTRQQAIRLGLKKYNGKLCSKHNVSERWLGRGECVECHKERNREYAARIRKEDPDRGRRSYNKWRKKNPYGLKSAVLKYTFGITFNDYREILKSQKYGCAICGSRKNGTNDHRTGKPRMLAVDHDHKTGKVRGLLCDLHNRGLGMFQDNIRLLRLAIKYLKKHGAKNARKNIRKESKGTQRRNQTTAKRTRSRI